MCSFHPKPGIFVFWCISFHDLHLSIFSGQGRLPTAWIIWRRLDGKRVPWHFRRTSPKEDSTWRLPQMMRESLCLVLPMSFCWCCMISGQNLFVLENQESTLSTWSILQESIYSSKFTLTILNPMCLDNFLFAWWLVTPMTTVKGCSSAPRIYDEQRRPRRQKKRSPLGVRQKKRHTEP